MRLAVLAPLTLIVVALLAISIVYATSGIPLSEALLVGFGLATITVLVLRGWMLGTFVNANGFKIVTLLNTKSGLWKYEYGVEIKKTTWRLLGLPIGIRSQRVVFTVPMNTVPMNTHIYLGSVDGIFTHERFDILFLLLRRWSAPE